MPDEAASKDTIQRLRRVEGQIKGIQKMIEDQRACDEILTQMMAARAALDQVAKQVVVQHIDECMVNLPSDRAKLAINRAIDMLGRMSS
jgi:DNA-binding FrmR family transcriptional regulator